MGLSVAIPCKKCSIVFEIAVNVRTPNASSASSSSSGASSSSSGAMPVNDAISLGLSGMIPTQMRFAEGDCRFGEQ